jgi:hypothetical protein
VQNHLRIAAAGLCSLNLKSEVAMGRVIRFAFVFTSLMLLGGLIGCVRTIYTSSAPPSEAIVLAIQLPTEGSQIGELEGTFSAPVAALRRLDTMVQLKIPTINGTNTEVSQFFFAGPIRGLPVLNAADGQEVDFELRRSTGSLHFTGNIYDSTAAGTARLSINGASLARLSEITGEPASAINAVRLLAEQIDLKAAEEFYAGGYRFSVANLLTLKRSGVSPGYAVSFRKAGYEFDAASLVQLRRMGVEAEYAAALREAGFSLDAEGLKRLRRMGVEASYAGAIKQAGVASDVETIIQLRRMGIEADYAKSIQSTGIVNKPDQIIQLRRTGIEAQYVSDIHNAGYPFGPDEMIRLRRMGVESGYATELKRAGYSFSAEEIVRLRRMGVESQYAAMLVSPGKQNLGAEEIIAFRRKGIDAETVSKLRQ